MKNPNISKGSFTVEVSLLFPMILVVLFAVVYLCAHVHNRTYLMVSCCETAISGKENPEPSLFAAEDIIYKLSDSDESRTVSCTAKTKGVFRIFDMDISVSEKYLKCDPVSFIKKFRLLKSVVT